MESREAPVSIIAKVANIFSPLTGTELLCCGLNILMV
jgi:hypothetical protein